MELTPEQRTIVEADRLDTLVVAGAGSGKTLTLVERYLWLLSRGHRIPELVAITFTEAAASEMRERVRRAVMEREAWAEHRRDLDEMIIGTIHSLCLRILQENPVEAAIDPRARVLGEDEALFEVHEAAADAIEAAAEAGGLAAEAVAAIGLRGVAQQLPEMVRDRDAVRRAFDAMLAPDGEVDVPRLRRLLDNAHAEALDELLPHAIEVRQALAEALPLVKPGDKLATMAQAVVDALANIEAMAPAEVRERLATAGSLVNLRGGSEANWQPSPLSHGEAKRELEGLRAIDRVLENLPRWNEHDDRAVRLLPGLRALFDDACRRFAARKRELDALDFLDLEIRAVQLLRDHPDVAERYRDRFKHVLVDEFQDTNALQVELVNRLCGRDASRGAALFAVGDPKQSIYRFRGSDVRRFNRFAGEILGSSASSVLTRSFRTHEALVDALNRIFDHVFADATADYEARMQRMAGRGGEPPRPPHVRLQPIADPERQKLEERDRRYFEADLLAARIRDMLDTRIPVWDRHEQRYRPLRPSDVAVLLRRLTHVHAVEYALEAHRVPYTTPQGTGFFTRQEVLDFGNLLAWLAEPDDQVALFGVLRSPMFLLDDETLLRLRAANRWDVFRAVASPPPELPGPAADRCRHATSVLQRLREESTRLPVDELLQHALEGTGVEAAWWGVTGGEQARANIRKLLDLARTLRGRSLDAFVDYLRRRRDLDFRESQARMDDRDAVRILTVHGAKGLEFPVVFVPEAHIDSRDDYSAIRWRDEGIAFNFEPDPRADPESNRTPTRPRPGVYQYLLQADQREDEAEHKRLFYVAATRAGDYLHVSGDDGKDGPGGWLGMALGALAGRESTSVEVMLPAVVDTGAVASRARPRPAAIPPPESEREVVPPLIARPRVIPIRTSTPVTALRALRAPVRTRAHPDGLGMLLGSAVHRAIELRYGHGATVDAREIIRSLRERALTPAAQASLARDVEDLLERFDASPLATELGSPAADARFEVPFAFDWQGLPIHGTIDLLYRRDDAWHVVDFKTDRVDGRSLEDVAAPYLPQLGLYGLAVERATGVRPRCSLFFLRAGAPFGPSSAQLDGALAAARERADLGSLVADEPPAEPVE